MKRLSQLVCCLALMLLVTSCGKNKFVIKGNLGDETLNGLTVYLYDMDDLITPFDSTTLKDGCFSFSDTVSEPWFGLVAVPEQFFFQRLIVEPGRIAVTDEGVAGTPLNDSLRSLLEGLEEIEEQMEMYVSQIQDLPDDPKAAALAEKEYDSVADLMTKNISTLLWDVYYNNDENIVGSIALEILIGVDDFSYQQLDNIVNAASPVVKKNKNIQKALAQMRIAATTAEGKHYIDIQGVNGNLSDLIDGKLAIVDFWASWCGPCRNEIEYTLVPLWNKYKNKGLVVVGVNVWERGDFEAQTAARNDVVNKLGITYPQIIDTTHNATEAYGVDGIPLILLIGPDGTILARGIRGEEVEAVVKATIKY